MSRQTLLAANWKMNHLRATTLSYAETLAKGLSGLDSSSENASSEIVLFPPSTSLALLAETLENFQETRGVGVGVGGQDLHAEVSGAHTGDVSAEMLLDCGASWGLCGHSERRNDHGEDDATVRAKVAAAQRAGLRPMLCIGETLQERESERTEEVLDRQLLACLDLLGQHEDSGSSWTVPAVAYEPVWAIGTGLTATPDIAQSAHSFLRRRVQDQCGNEASEQLRILYGGSVKPANCVELLGQPDIDGFLIGGAGLDPEQFLDIIRRCAGSS